VKFYYEARPWLFILLVLVFACRRSFRRQVCFSRKPLWTGSSRVPNGLVPLAIAAYLLCRLVGSLAEQYEKLFRTTLSDLANRRTSALVARLLSAFLPWRSTTTPHITTRSTP